MYNDDFGLQMMWCCWYAVDYVADNQRRQLTVPLHYNRLRRRNAFAACANHVCQCNRYRLRPLLVNYLARRHFFPMVRWFFAPIPSIDVLNAKCPIVKQPNATVAILNCSSMQTQTNQSLLRWFVRSMLIVGWLRSFTFTNAF